MGRLGRWPGIAAAVVGRGRSASAAAAIFPRHVPDHVDACRPKFEGAGGYPPLGFIARQETRAVANTDTEELTLRAKLVIAAGIALMVAGAVSHPVTIATVDRIWYQELARASAPMKFRFVLQPLMAALVAIRDGRKDARAGRSPYIWALLGEPRERRARLIRGLNAT